MSSTITNACRTRVQALHWQRPSGERVWSSLLPQPDIFLQATGTFVPKPQKLLPNLSSLISYFLFQAHFSHDWIGAWSVVCLFSCLFTVATFFVDVKRLPYPERPIIYMTFCFLAIAIIFLVGYGFEEDIVCNRPFENRTMNFLTERTIKQVCRHECQTNVLR